MTSRQVGKAFLTTYSLVFELISIVLLLAIIGALVLAQQGKELEHDNYSTCITAWRPTWCIGALLFGFGIYGLVARKTVIGMLISSELILAAASVNFMAFNRFLAPDPAVGQIFTLFIMAIAAAEAAIAVSIIDRRLPELTKASIPTIWLICTGKSRGRIWTPVSAATNCQETPTCCWR